jgi:hypothetical protein
MEIAEMQWDKSGELIGKDTLRCRDFQDRSGAMERASPHKIYNTNYKNVCQKIAAPSVQINIE